MRAILTVFGLPAIVSGLVDSKATHPTSNGNELPRAPSDKPPSNRGGHHPVEDLPFLDNHQDITKAVCEPPEFACGRYYGRWLWACNPEQQWVPYADCGDPKCCSNGINGDAHCMCGDAVTPETVVIDQDDTPPLTNGQCPLAQYSCGAAIHRWAWTCDAGRQWKIAADCGKAGCCELVNGVPFCTCGPTKREEMLSESKDDDEKAVIEGSFRVPTPCKDDSHYMCLDRWAGTDNGTSYTACFDRKARTIMWVTKCDYCGDCVERKLTRRERAIPGCDSNRLVWPKPKKRECVKPVSQAAIEMDHFEQTDNTSSSANPRNLPRHHELEASSPVPIEIENEGHDWTIDSTKSRNLPRDLEEEGSTPVPVQSQIEGVDPAMATDQIAQSDPFHMCMIQQGTLACTDVKYRSGHVVSWLLCQNAFLKKLYYLGACGPLGSCKVNNGKVYCPSLDLYGEGDREGDQSSLEGLPKEDAQELRRRQDKEEHKGDSSLLIPPSGSSNVPRAPCPGGGDLRCVFGNVGDDRSWDAIACVNDGILLELQECPRERRRCVLVRQNGFLWPRCQKDRSTAESEHELAVDADDGLEENNSPSGKGLTDEHAAPVRRDEEPCRDGSRKCSGNSMMYCSNGTWDFVLKCRQGCCIKGKCHCRDESVESSFAPKTFFTLTGAAATASTTASEKSGAVIEAGEESD